MAQVALKEVSPATPKKLKSAPRELYIAQFRVMYQLLYSQTEVAEGGRQLGGGYRGDAVAGLNMAVKGVNEADLRAITDEIYQNFVQKYKAAGYRIISADEAAGAKEYEGYVKKQGGTLNEEQFAGYITSTPAGYEYLVKSTAESGKEKVRFNGYKLSAGMGGAVVATVNVVVPFVEDAESGASKALGKALGGLAKIVVKPNLRLEAEPVGTAGAFSTDVAQTKVEFFFAEQPIKPLAYTRVQLAKNYPIAGVFEDKKYKAATAGEVDQWGSDYGAVRVFNVSDKYLESTHPVACEAAKYREGVTTAAIEYFDAVFDRFSGYAVGK